MLKVQRDYFVPLIRILDRLPNRSGRTKEVIEQFEQIFHDQIAFTQFTKISNGRFRWENNLRWSREKLKQIDFFDSSETGVWKLTEKGHQWLIMHPNATHLGDELNLSIDNQDQFIDSLESEQSMVISRDATFEYFETSLRILLTPMLEGKNFRFVRRSSAIQIRMDDFPGCHYELILRSTGRQEIALHFESTAERSQLRLKRFNAYLEDVKTAMEVPVYSGNFEKRGWTQVRIVMISELSSMVFIKEMAELSKKFISVTYPFLNKIYMFEKINPISSRGINPEVTDNEKTHILGDQVASINAYLLGRSSFQPTSEILCDWVYFCYTFAMYKEAIDIFLLINQTEVNEWYYERTKKIVRACEQKVKLSEMGKG